ncbi:DUF6817 domain-containing protein [Streptomyces antimicrobicus]|uniref:DUF6817 domain-containing protein n=1 Tax=Streptomyces antimicrobicus TaxID=2883108 RepID=A0ABS8B2E4_9ACTN|nr:hypothetical protein [Streptomyces antimicrobicus]MCB5178783.1 hypothetical protein [Streptomyces antimicrobicus]
MIDSSSAAERALSLLRRAGAQDVAHPGGTLLTHLRRVQARLASWQARPVLQLAGLCHASYGTDGFPTALLPLDRRAELVAAIGAEAEAVVYLYAACDRKATYPGLGEPDAVFHDRFTGRTLVPQAQSRRDFVELSAANELDLAHEDLAFRAAHGPDLLAFFTRVRHLLGPAAWHDCRTLLAAPPAPARRPGSIP